MAKGGSRWRRSLIILITLCVCTGFIFYVDVFHLRSSQIPELNFNWQYKKDGYLIKTEGCRIPYMDPFDPSVKKYIFKEKQVECNKNKPPLIESNLTSIYVLNASLVAYKVYNFSALNCCYSNITRIEPSRTQEDHIISYGKCIKFNKTANINTDFIRVSCSYNSRAIYKDFFSFVPIRTFFKRRSSAYHPLNVLIVGLDGVSRVNINRQMPKTVDMLNHLGAIEFLGHNKVADNTFPNVAAAFTGMSEKELTDNCRPKKTSKFDACPIIWKNYSDNGFATAFAEDAPWMGIFNFEKKGFCKQPTDHYWDTFSYNTEKEIGNAHRMNVNQCIGSREAYRVLSDYTLSYAKTMHRSDVPYFGLFWGSSLTHDYINKPRLGDDYYEKFFKNLHSEGILNNTVLIFMSDHGIRYGDIRTTFQGRMEERLPFLFMLLPKTYQEDYHHVVSTLKNNAKKLTTHFDVHETLIDLLKPFTLSQKVINLRVEMRKGNERAYSLFEPIPDNRTCESAGVTSHWCTCQVGTVINNNDGIVVSIAKYTVQYLNKLLVDYAECASLTLAEVYNARFHSSETTLQGNFYTSDYTISFRTVPGNGNFEATVRRLVNQNQSSFNMVDKVSRINLYGNQSHCITDFNLKLYCYCTT